jgi:hypothetical protein
LHSSQQSFNLRPLTRSSISTILESRYAMTFVVTACLLSFFLIPHVFVLFSFPCKPSLLDTTFQSIQNAPHGPPSMPSFYSTMLITSVLLYCLITKLRLRKQQGSSIVGESMTQSARTFMASALFCVNDLAPCLCFPLAKSISARGKERPCTKTRQFRPPCFTLTNLSGFSFLHISRRRNESK